MSAHLSLQDLINCKFRQQAVPVQATVALAHQSYVNYQFAVSNHDVRNEPGRRTTVFPISLFDSQLIYMTLQLLLSLVVQIRGVPSDIFCLPRPVTLFKYTND
jgi:hypothetical protein